MQTASSRRQRQQVSIRSKLARGVSRKFGASAWQTRQQCYTTHLPLLSHRSTQDSQRRPEIGLIPPSLEAFERALQHQRSIATCCERACSLGYKRLFMMLLEKLFLATYLTLALSVEGQSGHATSFINMGAKSMAQATPGRLKTRMVYRQTQISRHCTRPLPHASSRHRRPRNRCMQQEDESEISVSIRKPVFLLELDRLAGPHTTSSMRKTCVLRLMSCPSYIW